MGSPAVSASAFKGLVACLGGCPRDSSRTAEKLFLGAGYRISDCERAQIPDADIAKQIRVDLTLDGQCRRDLIDQEFNAAAP
jgi:hypothetical protein